MEYTLSEHGQNKKEEYENSIRQNNQEYIKLSDQIRNIRKNKDMNPQERQLAILELQIQQEEIEMDTAAKEISIENLYFKSIEDSIKQDKLDGKITAAEFSNKIQNLKSIRIMKQSQDAIQDYETESEIINLKLKIEYMKKSLGKTSREEADKAILELEAMLNDNEEYCKAETEALSSENYNMDKRNLYFSKKNGEISQEEFKEKLTELEENRNRVPTATEINEKMSELQESTPIYERETSNRDSFSVSNEWRKVEKQDINKVHNDNIYHIIPEFSNKTSKYGLEKPDGADYAEYVGNKLGEDYAKGLSGEKADMARIFASLETKGTFGEFQNPYTGEEVSGFDEPKLLLQLEKVNGLNIEEIEDTIGLDASILKEDIYIATYEMEEYDHKKGEFVSKPIKEYYQKSDTGEMIMIGSGTEKNITFNIDGMEIDIDPIEIVQGKSEEKLTQLEIGDKLIKDTVEETMKNGKVKELVQITDMDFLNDFAKQCGIEDKYDLNGRTFIVSTINEHGEENFDIIVRNDIDHDGIDTEYSHLEGIEATQKSGREMYTTTGMSLPGGAQMLNKTSTIKEFETQSGHRYAISRDKDGKLGFNEIVKDNNKEIRAEKVDTYTYSTSDLRKTYERSEINQEDISNAYKTVEKTKSEKEQTQEYGKENDSEGR